MASTERLYAFNRSDATALLATIAQTGTGSPGGTIPQGNEIYIGVTTSSIAAVSSGVCGEGTVQVKYIKADKTLGNHIVVNALNISGVNIDSGKTVILFRVGNRYIAVEVC